MATIFTWPPVVLFPRRQGIQYLCERTLRGVATGGIGRLGRNWKLKRGHENIALAAVAIFCNPHGAGLRISRSNPVPGHTAAVFQAFRGERADRIIAGGSTVSCPRADQH